MKYRVYTNKGWLEFLTIEEAELYWQQYGIEPIVEIPLDRNEE